MFKINSKFVKIPTVLLEINTKGNKTLKYFLLVWLHVKEKEIWTAHEDFTKISWAADVLNTLQLWSNNANHMLAYIFEIIILRACENMEHVNTHTST